MVAEKSIYFPEMAKRSPKVSKVVLPFLLEKKRAGTTTIMMFESGVSLPLNDKRARPRSIQILPQVASSSDTFAIPKFYKVHFPQLMQPWSTSYGEGQGRGMT